MICFVHFVAATNDGARRNLWVLWYRKQQEPATEVKHDKLQTWTKFNEPRSFRPNKIKEELEASKFFSDFCKPPKILDVEKSLSASLPQPRVSSF